MNRSGLQVLCYHCANGLSVNWRDLEANRIHERADRDAANVAILSVN